jgi:hypothetical protein
MNRDFEFRQLLRAYRAGIINEATFEAELGALEHGTSNGNGARGFVALGKTYANEREAVAAMLDRIRSGEANGEKAFTAWAAQCNTECIRSGLRIIAEREAYHARIFERRMSDLGLECKAETSPLSLEFTAKLGDATVSDNQKLLYVTSFAPDIDAFFKPFADLAENIKDDMESKEMFKLYLQDEMSSAKWLEASCKALNGSAPAASAPAPSSSVNAFV